MSGFLRSFREKERKKSFWHKGISLKGILGVPLSEKMMFTRDLAVMVKAGFPLEEALGILSQQIETPRFRQAIKEIQKSIQQGKNFSQALQEYPKIFPQLYVNMIKVAETAGNLDETLRNLTNHLKKEHDLRSRVKGALTYPAVILTAMILIGTFMLIFVVPKITGVLKGFNVQLPLMTRFVIGFSTFASHYIYLLFIFLLVGGYLFKKASRRPGFKKGIDIILLRIPILSRILKKMSIARFSRTLASLLKSGVSVVEALSITSKTLSNSLYRESLQETLKNIQKGESLQENLSRYPSLYPPIVFQMVGVGERAGALSDILEDLANFYEEEVDSLTQNLSSIIEPVIILLIGSAVGFFALAMLQPMFALFNGI